MGWLRNSKFLDFFQRMFLLFRGFSRGSFIMRKLIPRNKFDNFREEYLKILSSPKFRLNFLIISFICLVISRGVVRTFDFSLGYFYITLICLAGLWFGLRGGLTAAAAGFFVFFLEVNIYRYWAFRDLIVKSLFFRFFVYFLSGIITGYISEVEKKFREKLRTLAFYDELTGCINYRWTMNLLESEIARCRRYGKELSIAMVDIDHFKTINDMYGHLAGNDILKVFADVIKNNVRNMDIVSRYGGEEFLLILPEISFNEALVVLHRIKNKLSKAKISSPRLKRGVFVKFSAGIASFPYNGDDIQELVGAADNALYRAKRGGRDSIILERRKWLRVKASNDLRMEIVDPLGKKKIKSLSVSNISKKGILLFFSQDLPSEELVCRLHFSKSHPAKEFRCRIIHKDISKKEIYKVGVYFLDIPEDVQSRISNYTDYSPSANASAFFLRG